MHLDFVGDVDEWTIEQKVVINGILEILSRRVDGGIGPAAPGERAVDYLARGMDCARQTYGFQNHWDEFAREIQARLNSLLAIQARRSGR